MSENINDMNGYISAMETFELANIVIRSPYVLEPFRDPIGLQETLTCLFHLACYGELVFSRFDDDPKKRQCLHCQD